MFLLGYNFSAPDDGKLKPKIINNKLPTNSPAFEPYILSVRLFSPGCGFETWGPDQKHGHVLNYWLEMGNLDMVMHHDAPVLDQLAFRHVPSLKIIFLGAGGTPGKNNFKELGYWQRVGQQIVGSKYCLPRICATWLTFGFWVAHQKILQSYINIPWPFLSRCPSMAHISATPAAGTAEFQSFSQ